MRACRLVQLPHAPSRALATLLVFAATALVLAPSASAQTMPLNLTAYHLTFTSFSCTDPTNPFLCDVTATADVRSNLSTTPGSVTYTLVVDFSPSFDAPCNVVDETAAFTFYAGTITVHSYHQDCPATIRPGPRIDTKFTVTSGTGAFAGASGSGIERSGPGGPAAIDYHGTITF
jgi:hypothetical protein